MQGYFKFNFDYYWQEKVGHQQRVVKKASSSNSGIKHVKNAV